MVIKSQPTSNQANLLILVNKLQHNCIIVDLVGLQTNKQSLTSPYGRNTVRDIDLTWLPGSWMSLSMLYMLFMYKSFIIRSVSHQMYHGIIGYDMHAAHTAHGKL